MMKSIKSIVRSPMFKRGALLIGTALGIMCVTSAMAAPASGITLTALGTNIDRSVSKLAVILSDVALIAGIGFVMASFFKFHQHKLNPQQVPLSQGVTLILVGAGLMLFPTMLPTASKAVFGNSATIGKVGGSQIGSIVGGSSTK